MRSFADLLRVDPRRQREVVRQDVRVGARLLTRNPGFSITAILTLALGIGGSTAGSQLLLEQSSCQYNIVSSTVVAVYCSHRAGDGEVLDLFIAWRGQPGWFQHGKGTTGGGGQSGLGSRGLKGRVSQYAVYNGVTIAFDADFDAATVTIDAVTVPLRSVNAILIDHVEQPTGRQQSATLRIEPRLPLGQDVNLVLAQRSRELRQFLQCDVPMPAAASPLPQPPVTTVCEKLATKRP